MSFIAVSSTQCLALVRVADSCCFGFPGQLFLHPEYFYPVLYDSAESGKHISHILGQLEDVLALGHHDCLGGDDPSWVIQSLPLDFSNGESRGHLFRVHRYSTSCGQLPYHTEENKHHIQNIEQLVSHGQQLVRIGHWAEIVTLPCSCVPAVFRRQQPTSGRMVWGFYTGRCSVWSGLGEVHPLSPFFMCRIMFSSSASSLLLVDMLIWD